MPHAQACFGACGMCAPPCFVHCPNLCRSSRRARPHANIVFIRCMLSVRYGVYKARGMHAHACARDSSRNICLEQTSTARSARFICQGCGHVYDSSLHSDSSTDTSEGVDPTSRLPSGFCSTVCLRSFLVLFIIVVYISDGNDPV